MANSYTRGQNVRCTVAFKEVATQNYVDPATVLFLALNPNGGLTTYTYGVDPQLIKDSAGHYHADVVLSISGDWWYRFTGAGTYTGAGENRMSARESRFP